MKPFSLRSSDPYCLSAGLQEGQTKRTFKLSPRTKILTKESHFCDVQEQSSDPPPPGPASAVSTTRTADWTGLDPGGAGSSRSV